MDCRHCGLMIIYATGGSLGTWQMSTPGSVDGFTPLPTDNSSLAVVKPCLEKLSLTFRGTVATDNCGGNCSGFDSLTASVCPPDGFIRFVRQDGLTGWTAMDALSVKILFLAFNLGGKFNGSERSASISAPKCNVSK